MEEYLQLKKKQSNPSLGKLGSNTQNKFQSNSNKSSSINLKELAGPSRTPKISGNNKYNSGFLSPNNNNNISQKNGKGNNNNQNYKNSVGNLMGGYQQADFKKYFVSSKKENQQINNNKNNNNINKNVGNGHQRSNSGAKNQNLGNSKVRFNNFFENNGEMENEGDQQQNKEAFQNQFTQSQILQLVQQQKQSQKEQIQQIQKNNNLNNITNGNNLKGEGKENSVNPQARQNSSQKLKKTPSNQNQNGQFQLQQQQQQYFGLSQKSSQNKEYQQENANFFNNNGNNSKISQKEMWKQNYLKNLKEYQNNQKQQKQQSLQYQYQSESQQIMYQNNFASSKKIKQHSFNKSGNFLNGNNNNEVNQQQGQKQPQNQNQSSNNIKSYVTNVGRGDNILAQVVQFNSPRSQNSQLKNLFKVSQSGNPSSNQQGYLLQNQNQKTGKVNESSQQLQQLQSQNQGQKPATPKNTSSQQKQQILLGLEKIKNSSAKNQNRKNFNFPTHNKSNSYSTSNFLKNGLINNNNNGSTQQNQNQNQSQRDKENQNMEEEHFVQTCQGILYSNLAKPQNPKDLNEKKVYLKKRNPNHLKTIVFDLDETLIHCNENVNMPHDVQLSIKFPQGEVIDAGINVRPFAREILRELSKEYEIVIFTASHQCYAKAVIEHLDPKKEFVHHKFFREHCIQTPQGVYIKDLRIFADRKLEDLVLVDNAAYSFSFQVDNGIPIIPFYHHKEDMELVSLMNLLKPIKNFKDVREYLKGIFKFKMFNNPEGPGKVYENLFGKAI
ncbi:HAD-like domain [Pseudocohnilembus persalinus]|uniref:HAD-like domain n=1 Tax=Pseudocohnilembus persalinus TaxID=266149 RepID=A0A0V0QZS2_PSEPJ|nr:HAD-like domain [Pseudocohnilembus persalinus]|eukprot:KRX07565.1 HAD-like domain [Pseudocohnilembus persalinus]